MFTHRIYRKKDEKYKSNYCVPSFRSIGIRLIIYKISYFHNVFRIMTGIALKEYIRNRRLVSSAYELVNTDGKIIDLAYKYQYETPESFTRAFTKMFEVTLSVYRKNNKHAIVFLP
ncbi:hypothetical protein GCM10008908_34830 [Clostridium subterminale]|uniref:HTH araC/xylS-type domain-containing protein n=1 Tax=Clostridium subterminale TaxID=1550 RepID=A0ABN1KXN5_CLOSU